LLATLALASPAFAQTQLNQTFNSVGPSPSTGQRFVVGSGDSPPNGTVTGAVQSIVTSPTDPNTWYIGTPGGGVWVTHNAGTTWTALTDNQASLSIASLAIDPTNANALVAGTGLTANGTPCRFSGNNCDTSSTGGLRNGLLFSTNGGTRWTSIGAATFAGQTVDAVTVHGSTILAGTYETSFYSSSFQRTVGALYMSTNGGTGFTQISGTAGTGLPTGPVTSLATDPANPNRIYAAVAAPSLANTAAGLGSTALYVSSDGGATWSAVFAAAQAAGTINNNTQTKIKVATGPGGAIAVAVIDLGTNKPTGLFYSSNSGTSWSSLVVPNVNGGGQANTNFAIAIDPNNNRFVYVSGDNNYYNNGGINAVAAYRIDTNTPGVATSLGDDNGVATNTSNGSTVHPDSRAMAFDASGRLILSSDGGIYARSSPQTTTGAWTSLNGNLSVSQPYSLAIDANSKLIAIAAQDNGAALQTAPGSGAYRQLIGGDGVNAVMNDRTLTGQTALYTNYQYLGQLNRLIINSDGSVASPGAGPAGIPVSFNVGVNGLGFNSPFVLNKADPTRIAVGGSNVYVTQDTLTGGNGVGAAAITLNLTDLGNTGGAVSAVAFGTSDNHDVLVAGSTSNTLWLSTTAAAGSLVQLTAYTGAGPASIVLDPRSQNRFYTADFSQVFGTQNQGTTFSNLTANLPATLITPNALEFISSNGVNALLVGGQSNAANAQSTIAVADSDASGNLSNWRLFGNGLPNSTVSQLTYNPTIDALAVATFGRGVFALYDVTSYFAQATVLQFGLANNNSMPDASFLTNGTVGNRPLIKYGTGTLTIAGNATYTGGTTINDGIVQVGTGGTAGSILGNVTFCSNGADPQCNPGTNKALVFDRSDLYTFGGSIAGAGQVAQTGSGELVLGGNSTYTGPTTVFSGILSVSGSITSAVTVNSGAALGGSGSVGSTTIMAGGTLAPGDPKTLTVNGNLVFNPGSNYVVMVQGATSDRTNVTGTAALAGNGLAGFLGGALTNNYILLSAAGGRTGTFDTFSTLGLPAFVTASLLYTPTDVDLRLNSGIANLPALTRNQQSVANALDFSFNNGGGTLAGLLGLTANQIPGALTSLSGEGVAGTQETTFGASNLFLSVMMDQGQFWRSGDLIDPNGVTYPAANGYAAALPYKAPPLKALPAYEPRWRGWVAGFDGTFKLRGDSLTGSADLSHDTAGGAAGIDYQINPNLLVGGAAGGSSSHFSVSDRATSGNIDGAHLGLYGVSRFRQLYAAAAFTFASFDNQTSRTVAGVGPTEIESGKFNSYLYGGRVEAGFAQRFGKFTVTPFAAVQFSEIRQSAFNETNPGGLLALNFQAKSIDSFPTFLGAQFDTRVYLANGMAWSPYGRLSWVHEFDPVRRDTETFATLPLATFTVDGARAAHDSARVDLGSKLQVKKNAWLFANFLGEFSNVSQMYAGKAGLRVAW